jgi:hypothetical protein
VDKLFTGEEVKMSLNWNAERVAGLAEMKEDKAAYADLSNFCWALMAIGVRSVTTENAGEVYVRICIWESLYGPIRYDADDRSVYASSTFVKSMVGYSTNVSSETMSVWTKRITGRKIAEVNSRTLV